MHPVKRKIIKMLRKEDGAFFGEIVMNLKKSQGKTLYHLLDLKSRGIIYKDSDGGKYKLVSEN